MDILAIDLGTKSLGWAAWCSVQNRLIVGEEKRLAPGGRGQDVNRWRKMARDTREWMHNMLKVWRPDLIVIERPYIGQFNKETGVVLFVQMVAVAEASGEMMVDPVIPPTWQAWAKKNIGWAKKKGDDANDAAAIWHWWKAQREHLVVGA